MWGVPMAASIETNLREDKYARENQYKKQIHKFVLVATNSRSISALVPPAEWCNSYRRLSRADPLALLPPRCNRSRR